ncbi:P-loop containing nucleoside triphosphate hydrolase protein [Mycena epipterygia]|nr:P-loop containing nucleoside triphosphate hydrolase protein [Mycena epipterygia]
MCQLIVVLSVDNVALTPDSLNTCPPPSRIFHGRKIILDKMHHYFMQGFGKQPIFLLHGLGGAGKTQIALKFIQNSSFLFSDIFLIDASTVETIETGLKNIATAKHVGSTLQDSLRWLSSGNKKWLLFFDNADDPKINLNSFLPHCNHGNILITSRNPGLCVYAGAHALVSDMEEANAVELLTTSAAQETTSHNQELAAEIALWYMPLAIIQAGAFIAKSGSLKSYLALYTQNQAHLLSEKPAQSHDNYAWTVYTTWQMSFDKLSPAAATLLQLASFLHHQGISEQIFSNASTYKFQTTGPSEEELQKPLEFLSQFLGPTGSWQSLRFTHLTNELRAYSLIDFNSETNLFSIHPLVHDWSQSTLADKRAYQHCMVAILGMSIATMNRPEREISALWLVPHVDSLLQGEIDVAPDFNMELMLDLANIYRDSGQFKQAADLEIVVLEQQKQILGEDHLHTLSTMKNLVVTYIELGQFKEAEELADIQVGVLGKLKRLFGEDHAHTIWTMGNLGSTYRNLGKLKEAEELEVSVLNKQKKVMGEDHPYTLWTMGNLALTYYKQGQLNVAKQIQLVVLQKRKRILGDEHPDTLRAVEELASTCTEAG